MTVTTAPMFLSSISACDNITAKQDKLAWLGISVLIARGGHGSKGLHGIVKDVLLGQKTSSGLQLVIEFEHYSPSTPFHR